MIAEEGRQEERKAKQDWLSQLVRAKRQGEL